MKHNRLKKTEELVSLKASIRDLQERAKDIEAELLDELITEDVTTLKTDIATITVARRKVWEYPSYIRDSEEELKLSKKEAQKNGRASYSPTYYLVFTPAKIEEVEPPKSMRGKIH